MATKVRKFVSREFARTVDLQLLERFLAPFIDRIEFDLTALPEDEEEKREAIFEFFRGADDRFPPKMQNALHGVSTLSTPGGSRLLQEQADVAGIVLVPREELEGPEDGRHLTPRHLALRAYLDHRAVFNRALDISAFWSVSSPLELVGAREGVECRHTDPAAQEAFRSAVSAHFTERYNGRYCDVRWYPEDDEVNILVLHGRNPRTANVEQDGSESTLSYREIAQDTIRYHAASGRVKIGAGTPPDRRKLVELFAEHLLGEPDFFKGNNSDRLYTLEPIRTRGTGFRFRHEWDEDITSVTVREIQIDEGEHEVNGRMRYSPWAMTVRDSRDAIARLAELAPDVHFADLRINYVKLEFRFDVDEKESRVMVKIKPPNIASFRDHSFEKTIMEHLELNGLRIAKSVSAAAAAE
ncbi:MAG TPA: hypothetical protein VMN39_02465 [Longimicrobiaceae bacterium]|nr:hypothetical protein [Longimicrobiaceae bacterium]